MPPSVFSNNYMYLLNRILLDYFTVNLANHFHTQQTIEFIKMGIWLHYFSITCPTNKKNAKCKLTLDMLLICDCLLIGLKMSKSYSVSFNMVWKESRISQSAVRKLHVNTYVNDVFKRDNSESVPIGLLETDNVGHRVPQYFMHLQTCWLDTVSLETTAPQDILGSSLTTKNTSICP